MMPTARPFVGDEEAVAVSAVLASGWLGTGPKTSEFESALQAAIGCTHAVAVSSGTAALQLALQAFDLGVDAEVLVPSLTFCSSVQAILAAGATPVFTEVDPATLCLDVADARRRVSPRTRAIMPVHYGGQPCAMDEVLLLAHDHELVVVEDAAHAFGSQYHGQAIGTIGHATCFSFDPIKTITCGEGGAITTNDESIATRLRSMRLLGMSSDGYSRYKRSSAVYQVEGPGYRYHMSDICASIGLAQLDKYPNIASRRRYIAHQYREQLAGLSSIACLQHDLEEAVPFNFVIRILNGRRDDLLAYLQERGIGAGVHYPPNHLQPYFAPYHSPLPCTEAAFTEILTIPLFPSLDDADVCAVTAHIRNWCNSSASRSQPTSTTSRRATPSHLA